MSVITRFKSLLRNEDGAVTVDWVVLTGIMCFVSITIVASIQNAAVDQATGIGASVISQGSNALNPNVYP